jgi:hypothetical protein
VNPALHVFLKEWSKLADYLGVSILRCSSEGIIGG